MAYYRVRDETGELGLEDKKDSEDCLPAVVICSPGTEYLWVLAAEIKGWDGGGRLGNVRIFRVPREWR